MYNLVFGIYYNDMASNTYMPVYTLYYSNPNYDPMQDPLSYSPASDLYSYNP